MMSRLGNAARWREKRIYTASQVGEDKFRQYESIAQVWHASPALPRAQTDTGAAGKAGAP